MDAGEAVIWKALERQKGMKDLIALGDSPVQQFYHDSTLFVTGGTGFLGKQLIEKLFRTCRLRKVYMLMRAKKGKSVEERLTEALKDPLYDTLRDEQPDFVNRIVPIVGDMSERNLAICDEDKEVLIKEVDVIFHVAATIAFQQPLRSATLTNVRGTRDLLTLARLCRKLRSFIYISTAYCHATFSRRDTVLLEQFYSSPVPPHLMISMAETIDEDRLNGIADELLADWPNTYSFSKALAEELVRSSVPELPVCIIRPTIVICTRREPYPGWIDPSCVFGPSGITVGCMMGVIHALHSRQDIRIDFIPVDYVNNVAITAAAAGTSGRIYCVGSSRRNCITWGGLSYILNNTARRTVISQRAIWYCFVVQSPHEWVYRICSFLLHTIPANLVDGVCVLVRKPPQLKKIYATISKMAGIVAFYTNNNWIFDDSNTVELFQSLSDRDKMLYHCDIADVGWTEQIVLWCVGLRNYVVKDGLNNTALGMKKQLYFRIATYVLSVMFSFLLYYCLRFIFLYVFG